MKKLILVRHAKSSWEYDVIDHERPLKKRGINDANIVSKNLKTKNFEFDKVLSSDALRAKATANIFKVGLSFKNEIELNHKLYDFSGRDMLEVIKSCDNNVETLLVFGHNHAITDFANTYGNYYIDNVPTSGVVVIEFEIDNWGILCRGNTICKLFPRDYRV
ncbi:histidine phosphatase family protein [Seonamhaeicola sp. MEBiC1930]|uniref:SixA phosphatase family protein n=1 Tax=Seonamhaeicola sp. MEBiC01930 TaxID=2976768 RepID=UPI00324D263E